MSRRMIVMSAVRYLTASEAAALLSVSEATVRRKVASGDIPAKRFSERCLRIPASELQKYIRESDAKRVN